MRSSLLAIAPAVLGLFGAPAPAPAAQPPAEAAAPAGLADVALLFPGKKFVTVDLVDAEIRSVLGIIAKKAGVTMLISDGVSGKITVKARDMPLLVLLELVLKQGGLAVERSGSSLLVFKKC